MLLYTDRADLEGECMYSLMVLDEATHSHHAVSQYNEEEFADIKQLLEELNNVFDNDTKYQMMRRNDAEFLKYCDGLTGSSFTSDEIFTEINRLFENVVDSFYSWIGFNEKNYNTIFASIKKAYFVNNIEYRLAYGLRIFCEHHALSFRKYTMKLDTGEIVFDVDPGQILKVKKPDGKSIVNNDIQKDLNELMTKDEGIHLRELVIGLDMLMPKIERDIMREIHNDVNPRIARLISPVDGIRTRFIFIQDDEEEKAATGNLVAPINKYFETMQKHGVRVRD